MDTASRVMVARNLNIYELIIKNPEHEKKKKIIKKVYQFNK